MKKPKYPEFIYETTTTNIEHDERKNVKSATKSNG